MTDKPIYSVTIDTDWVPQFMLDHVLDMLRDSNVPATIFCTSPYDIEDSEQIEIGLHPNMMENSTHGDSEESRFAHVASLYPNAIGCRTHSCYWHGRMYDLLIKHKIQYDSSLLVPFQDYLKSFTFRGVTRFPIWCGDNLYMHLNPDTAVFNPSGMDTPGLKVLHFHPVHIWFNSRTVDETRAILDGRSLPELNRKEAHALRRKGNGLEKIFADALRQLSGKENTHTLRSLL
ncbi:hypothetical protein [Maridesulfovibrio sp.]|uniref:polysaccharide deacetylase WbmS family protein n=1 Tax=Maridesulfovibrio sp. TaxID=2795000 RepID=UPI003BADB273